MNTRELFKKLVAEAKGTREEATTVLGTHGSHRREWFEKNKNREGKYAYLTDQEIDMMSERELHDTMIKFIADCFQQR
ncbi:hypothetical protein RsoM2USA_324 [Ralstonia phage RsoM2USA]|nr:hypothetical protein RsoM2USA_324 [Ralstonia phage RsoM2USA]